MSFLSKLRVPYREDRLFGILFLLALFVPLAFDFYNFESFEIIKFAVFALLTGAGLLVFFKKYFFSGSREIVLRGRKPFFLAIILFLAWGILASFAAADFNYSFFGFYPRFTNGLLFYFIWAILFFLLAGINRQQVWFLLKVLFFCAGLVAFWGILESIGIGYYVGASAELFTRSAPSFLGNPNFSSMFMAVLVPLGVYFFFTSESFKARIYYSVSLFLQIWAVVVLASRGAMLALAFGLVVCLVFLLIFRIKGSIRLIFCYALLLLCFAALGLAFLNFARPGTLAATVSLKEANVQQRFGVWRLSLNAIKEKPLLGYGLGNFELLFEKERRLSTIRTGFFDDPHNLFLYLAATGGVAFLLLFLFLVFYRPVLELKQIISGKTGNTGESFALFGSLAAWLAASFFTPVAIPCYVLLAFLLSAFFSQSHSFKITRIRGFRFLAKVFAWALVVYALSFILAEHLFFASIRAYNRGDFVKSHSYVRAAVYLNPSNSLYYEYLAGSAARAEAPLGELNKDIQAFAAFHAQRSYTYVQIANLYYLLLYKTQDPAYQAIILENLEKAIAMDPYASSNYFLLSQYRMVFGDLDGAILAANKGLDLDGGNMEAWVFLAKIYQYQGNREMVLKMLNRALLVADDKINIINLVAVAKAVPDIRSLSFTLHLSLGELD